MLAPILRVYQGSTVLFWILCLYFLNRGGLPEQYNKTLSAFAPKFHGSGRQGNLTFTLRLTYILRKAPTPSEAGHERDVLTSWPLALVPGSKHVDCDKGLRSSNNIDGLNDFSIGHLIIITISKHPS